MHSEFSGTSLPSTKGTLLKNWQYMCENVKFLENCAIVCTKQKQSEKMLLLGMDTCPSLNGIMEIRCIKCTRSEQVYDF